MKNAPKFHPGFRISVTDVIVLILGASCSVGLASLENPFGLVIFFTLAHFFLFCNVLRLRRRFELIWAALFVVLASQSMLVHVPTWPVTVTIMLAATCILALLQLRQPSYHGVFWRQINPGLPQWWAARQQLTEPEQQGKTEEKGSPSATNSLTPQQNCQYDTFSSLS